MIRTGSWSFDPYLCFSVTAGDASTEFELVWTTLATLCSALMPCELASKGLENASFSLRSFCFNRRLEPASSCALDYSVSRDAPLCFWSTLL